MPHGTRSSVTLADVAQAAGVTKSTVSRVLNNYTRGFSVSAQVRRRITKAVGDLGYAGNPVVRSLRAHRTMLVQVVNQPAPSMHPSGESVVSLGTCIYFLQREGYTVIGRFARHFQLTGGNLPDLRVDGAILLGVAEARDVRGLDAEGVPYVVINGEAGASGACIKVDEAAGMRSALSHLVELGHERIAYLNASHALGHKHDLNHYSVASRALAYRTGMAEMDLRPIPGHRRTDLGAREFVRSAVARHGATAVIAYDHLHAIGLYEQLRAKRIECPRDISIVCFNDHPPTGYLTPPLTAVSQPLGKMGHEAAMLLLEMMREPRRARGKTVTLEPGLTVRASTAAPGAGESRPHKTPLSP